jgi:hypothetical protein
METTTDEGRTITPLDRASFQLQNTIAPPSHHHGLCIFACDGKSLHAVLVKVCTSGGSPFSQLQWWHHQEDVAHIVHLSSSQTDGRQKAPNLNYTMGRTIQQNLVLKLVWGLELLCCRRKVVFFSGLTLEKCANIQLHTKFPGSNLPIFADELIEGLFISWAHSCEGLPGM